MARLKTIFNEEIINSLKSDIDCSNIMAVPKLQKIKLNMGVGEAVADKKVIEKAAAELSSIAGQKAIVMLSKKSIAGFKIRDGWPVGCKVTLRGERMYEFLDRLVNVAIPRIRDFRGMNSKAFDGRGNYNMGLQEQIVFPEIDFEKTDAIRGLDIAFTTTATNDDDARKLLSAFGFPFKS